MHDPSFVYRLIFELSVFGVLALRAFLQRPRNVGRLKEYAFLFGMTVCVMGYTLFHDWVIWSIDPIYYVLGKGLLSAEDRFSGELAKMAVMAGWTVGLIGAAVMLVSNNPGNGKVPLGYRRLLLLSLIPFVVSVVMELVSGWAFYQYPGTLTAWLRQGAYYTVGGRNFAALWGLHLGAYGGGVLGLVWAAGLVVREKRDKNELKDIRDL